MYKKMKLKSTVEVIWSNHFKVMRRSLGLLELEEQVLHSINLKHTINIIIELKLDRIHLFQKVVLLVVHSLFQKVVLLVAQILLFQKVVLLVVLSLVLKVRILVLHNL